MVTADFLLSIVPPGNALLLAEQFAPLLGRNNRKPIYVDCNAVNPPTVERIAAVIADTGAPFVDAGIVGPPPRPGGKATAFYASGTEAPRFATLRDFGLDVRVIDGPIGAASALKMSYAGITKGITAIASAMMLASTRAGTAEALHRELGQSQPELLAWFTRQIPLMYSKAYRWVAEMEEIAGFVGEDKAAAKMFEGTARFYEQIARDEASSNQETQALEHVPQGAPLSQSVMLSAEQNELITRTGPGSAAGWLLRHYWQPAALVDELRGNRPVKPVRLLGENLVIFRDDKGRYGLLERACPHRGTDLAFGRLEDGGLRCAFHGWLFDVHGKCLQTPAEPDDSPLRANIRQKAYPVVEKSGILFAYLGPGEPPGIPAFRLFCRARQPYLCLQGHDRLQLAAIARSRNRSGAHVVPAPLFPGRRPFAGLWQAVPRHVDRFRNADDEDHARIPAPSHRGRADRLRLPPRHAAADQRAEHAYPRHQSHVPQCLRHTDEPRDDHHAMARADRRP